MGTVNGIPAVALVPGSVARQRGRGEIEKGKRGHTEEEILRVLREAESGETMVEICRKRGIRSQSFHLWKDEMQDMVSVSGHWVDTNHKVLIEE